MIAGFCVKDILWTFKSKPWPQLSKSMWENHDGEFSIRLKCGLESTLASILGFGSSAHGVGCPGWLASWTRRPVMESAGVATRFTVVFNALDNTHCLHVL